MLPGEPGLVRLQQVVHYQLRFDGARCEDRLKFYPTSSTAFALSSPNLPRTSDIVVKLSTRNRILNHFSGQLFPTLKLSGNFRGSTPGMPALGYFRRAWQPTSLDLRHCTSDNGHLRR